MRASPKLVFAWLAVILMVLMLVGGKAGAQGASASVPTTPDSFSSWSSGSSGSVPGIVVSVGVGALGRGSSMKVTRTTTSGVAAQVLLSQMVQVRSGARLEVSAKVRTIAAATGAVVVRFDSDPRTDVALPSGDGGWRTWRTQYTVPRLSPLLGLPKIRLQVVSAGATHGTYIDDMSVRLDGREVLQNRSFDQNSAAIHLTNSSLVFERTHVALNLELGPFARGTGSFTWRLVRDDGLLGADGKGVFDSGMATFKPSAPAGYYTLQVVVRAGGRVLKRSTNIVLLPAKAGSRSYFASVGVHFGQTSVAEFANEAASLSTLGIRNIRAEVSWPSVEVSVGLYKFPSILDGHMQAARAAGLHALLIPDYSNRLYDGGRTPSTARGIAAYAKFAAAVARHYPSAGIDVYNEFNGIFNSGTCGKSPSCYLDLLRPTYAALKARAGSVQVSAPSIAGSGVSGDWLAKFISAGGLRHTSVLSIHPYQGTNAPDGLDGMLRSLNKRIASAGAKTPIWFTEFGYSTAVGRVTEQRQANYLLRATAIAKANRVQRLYWYDAFDDSTVHADPESSYGLFRTPTSFAPLAWVPKPSAAAEGVSTRLLAGRTSTGSGTTSNGVRWYAFSGSPKLRVVWATGGARTIQVPSGTRARSMTGATTATSQRDGGTYLTIGQAPLYLTG